MAALTAAWTLVVAATAAAHGGALLASVQAGPFRTQVTAARISADAGAAIDYTVYLTEEASARPVQRAAVRVLVTAPRGATSEARVREVGGGYEAHVPVRNGEDVRSNRVRVEIRAPQGRGLVEIAPIAAGGPPAGLVPGTVAATLVALAATFAVRRRRRRAEAGRELDA